MKRSVSAAILLFLITVFIFAGTASSEAKKANDDTITFRGDMTLTVNGKDIQVKKSRSIPIPTRFEAWTQDDHPIVMASLFKDEGFISRKPDITVRTSKAFSVSGKRILNVSEITTYKDEYTDPAPGLVALKGKTIPARTGDYYIEIEPSDAEMKKIYDEAGYKDENGEIVLDAACLLYIKIHVEAVK